MAIRNPYDKRNRDNLAKLAPNTRAKALEWYEWTLDNGYAVLIYETLRTKEKQAEYVRTGKSQTMTSYHLVGQALDWVPVVNGKSRWDLYRDWIEVIEKAEALGFTSGYRWGWDSPHLQYEYKGYGTDKVLDKPAKKPASKPASKPKTTTKKKPVTALPSKPKAKVGSKVVATSNVWLHVTPDIKSSSRYAILYKGMTLKYIGEKNGMYLVENSKKQRFYVSRHYVKFV